MRRTAALASLALFLAALASPATTAPLVADHAAADAFGNIPASYFQAVRDHYRFFYGRTSHGSQLCSGLHMLAAEEPELWADVTMTEYSADLGTNGDLTWATTTRAYLATHSECNAVLWSWCGGVSTSTPEEIDAYLQAMNQLESDFPGVLFVYMTGHLDGTGPTGALCRNNDRIRAWCAAHDKVLYDFADIESVNPDGVSFPDDSDACAWCSAWCATHDCPACADCAHSHCFNCDRKGRAFWWLMTRALGWQPPDSAVGQGAAELSVTAHPNPFALATTLAFTLARAGAVRLRIVDAAGRSVATLADARLPAGPHEFTWDGRSEGGERAPAGLYFARLTAPGLAHTERLVLFR
jgi:hypothetical protein